MTKNLVAALNECKGQTLPAGAGILLYHMASKIKPQVLHHLPLLVQYIVAQKLDTTLRVEFALEFLLKNGVQSAPVNTDELDMEDMLALS